MGLAATALISWLFVLPVHLRGHVDNPYIGIVVFLIIPIVLVIGLAMVPVESFSRVGEPASAHGARRGPEGRRAPAGRIPRRHHPRQRHRRDPGHVSGRGAHGDRPVLRPDLPRDDARVPLPRGFAARPRAVRRLSRRGGSARWMESKMAGTRQLVEVTTNSYPRPIPSAMETNRLVPARETCETCHWPEKFVSARLKLITRFAEDEANTPSQTVLMMMVGGSLMPGFTAPTSDRVSRSTMPPPTRSDRRSPGGIPQHEERRDAFLPRRGRRRGRRRRPPPLHDAVRGLSQPPHPHVRVAGPGRRQGDGEWPAPHHASVPEEEGGGVAEGRLRQQRRGGPPHPRRARGLLREDLLEGGLRTRGGRGRGRKMLVASTTRTSSRT